MRAVCVFCGSSPGRRPEYATAAAGLGRLLASRGLRVVYGGAHVGLMGALADAALAGGGEVVGVIPRHLVSAEIAHTGLTTLHVVSSMHERKALMATLSDGFIALPGGMGTLEEFAEITTWSQLGLHLKPTGLLNMLGYFDHLLRFLDNAVGEHFLRPGHRELVIARSGADDLLAALEQWLAARDRGRLTAPPLSHKWVNAEGSDVNLHKRT